MSALYTELRPSTAGADWASNEVASGNSSLRWAPPFGLVERGVGGGERVGQAVVRAGEHARARKAMMQDRERGEDGTVAATGQGHLLDEGMLHTSSGLRTRVTVDQQG